MPTYRSLTISLISQFDILTIPEYAPPSIPPDPFTDSSNIPTLVDPSTAIVSIYIPTYPCSQFWLSYSIAPPWPPGLLYYFKLFVNGTCLVSWGCGEEDGYKGKTMFGMFASPAGRGIERRSLAFGPRLEGGGGGSPMPGLLDDVMEVRVFRSKGRKRVVPEVKEYRRVGKQSSSGSSKKMAAGFRGDGIDLVNAGFLHQKHPQRFYRYALLDALDQPFSTFRYYYRTWDQLEALGVISRPPSSESSSFCSDPPERVISRKSSVDTTHSLESVVDTFKAMEADVLGPVDCRDLVRDLSTPESDSANKGQASTRCVSPAATTTFPRRYRPATPPPSTSGPKKVTFMPTATGLVPTNLEPNPLALHPSALIAAAPIASSPSSSSQSALPLKPSLANQTSRESFATLVRTRINSPNPDSFKLTDLSATIDKISLKDPPAAFEKAKRERNMGSMGALRSVFGRDNLRDASRDSARSTGSGGGGSGRSRSVDGFKDKSTARSAHMHNSSGAKTGEQVGRMQVDECGEGTNSDGGEEKGKGKGKSKGKENEKGAERKRQNSTERGRSRSKKGEGRKLHLWEEI